jgi:hypothetical protein
MKSLVVFFNTNCQYNVSWNINEHSLPATRSVMLMFLVVFFSTICQYKTSWNINEHSLPATRYIILRFFVVFFSTNCQYKTSWNINEHSLPATRSVFLKFLVVFYSTKLHETPMNIVCLQLVLLSWGFSRFPSIWAVNTEFHQNVNLQVLLIRRSGLSCSSCSSQSLGILPSSRPQHYPRKYYSTSLPQSFHSTLRNLDSWYETPSHTGLLLGLFTHSYVQECHQRSPQI